MDELSGSLKFEEQGLSAGSPVKYFIRTFKTDNIIRLHYHNSLEINICRGVKGVIRLGGAEQLLSTDCLILLPPETPHSYLINSCDGTIEVFHILPEAIPGAVEVLDGVLETIKIPVSKCSAELISHLNGIKDSNTGSRLVILGHILLFLGELTRIKQADRGVKPLNNLPGGKFLRKVIDYTESNYHEKISLDEISSCAGVSKYHFCRMFKKETGETWSEYLRAVRLINSLRFLRDGMSVAETAAACGFESDSYYIKCFKKEYFSSPLQYVKAELSK